MINRSLIRIKTVQILYSYLLTRTDFRLMSAPPAGDDSRDKKFGYSVYLDLIFLLLKLSGLPFERSSAVVINDPAFKKNRVGRALRDDATVNAVLMQHRYRSNKFDSCINELVDAIKASAVYADYKRRRKLDIADDIQFWNVVFSTVIRKNKGVERVLRADESFTTRGFEQGIKKLVDTLSSFDDSRSMYLKARNDLEKSLSMAYSLYHALLALPIHITALQEQRIEAAKNKYLPTPEDLNPNMKFVDNSFVAALRDCEALKRYIDDNPEADPSMWRDSDIMISSLLDKIVASDIYAKYIDDNTSDYATDAAFWRDIMRVVIVPSDELSDALEARSVYWNDDLDIMSTFVLKTIRRSYAGLTSNIGESDVDAEIEVEPTIGRIELLPKFMNHDDEVFGSQLFEYVVKNREVYRSYIDRFINTEQWDPERLAFMDIVIMMTAIAEVENYPTIPVPVTFNEYIEIANDYSTQRSGQFINGILYSIIKMLNDEGIIAKH
ncbi:MAG: transcription antitermination protein NusB [Muribaculaceae bacterium]|nr:transcription antitermination protein NusB [Muribaculaceae bacterium]